MNVATLLFVLMGLCVVPTTGLGVDTIENPATPAHGRHTLELEELWRVGGPDDEDTVFGQIVRVVGDAADNTYVLDAQLQEAYVYDETGTLTATLFGQGDGPGEIRRAGDLTLMPDGIVAAVNRYPGSMVMVRPDGTPTGSMHLTTPGRGFAGAVYRGGNLVLAEMANAPHDDGTHTVQSILGSVDDNGERIAVYLQSDRHVDYQNNYVFDERSTLVDFLYSFDVGPDGRVYALGDPDHYAVSVFSPAGELERVIERAFEPRRRTKAETERMEALTRRRFLTFPFDISYVFAEHEAVTPWYLCGLQVRDDGSLWVRHSRSGETDDPNLLIVFDVFNSAGVFDRQVAVPAPGRAATAGVFLIGDDRLVVVHGFVDAMCSVVGGGSGETGDDGAEPDPIAIVCYRIIEP